jgi:hypothetical protein
MLQSVLNQRAAWPQWAAANLARARSHFAFDDMLERWRLVFDGHVESVPDLLAEGRA